MSTVQESRTRSSSTKGKIDVLERGLFRKAALTHYEQWGGEFTGRRENRQPTSTTWQRVAVPVLIVVCLLVVGRLAAVRLPVMGDLPVLLLPDKGGRTVRVVAVFSADVASLVRAGTTVRLVVAGENASEQVAREVTVSGSGDRLTGRQVRAAYPALAGRALLANNLIGTGVLPASGLGIPGKPVVVTGWGPVALQSWLIPAGLAGS
jgi:hypothetical protein